MASPVHEKQLSLIIARKINTARHRRVESGVLLKDYVVMININNRYGHADAGRFLL
jgi:hypothetical protein